MSDGPIKNRRRGGESRLKIAYFIHRSTCGAANIQILNWSEGCGGSTGLRVRLAWQYSTLPNFSTLPWRLSIWLLMAEQSDVYIKDAELCVVSPPVLRFSIWPLLTAPRHKTFQKMPFFTRFRSRCNRHSSHRKSENGRRIYAWFCINSGYITLFGDQLRKLNCLHILCFLLRKHMLEYTQICSQLSFRPFITEQSDVYEIYAKSCVDSPPVLRFSMRRMLVASRSKTCGKRHFLERFVPRRG